jgi:hypothetical protein
MLDDSVFLVFWVATQFNELQISDDLKNTGLHTGRSSASHGDFCIGR